MIKQKFAVAAGEKRGFINTITKPPKRRCSRCNSKYYRVNSVEQWTGRNMGKRLGWHKDRAKICLNCQDVRESIQMMELADVKFYKKSVVRKHA